jgi:type IV secretory pathway VirB10-like protein
MKVQRHVLRLNPASSLQDAMLAEKLRNEPFSFSSIVKVLLVNFYSINGGLCLDEESRIEVARIYPRCANKIKDAEDTPKKKPTPKSEQVVAPKPAKAPPAAPAPAAEAVAPTVAPPTTTEPAPSGDQVPRRKPPTYEEFYKDVMDAEF